jgi:hypothetical protein
LIGLFTAGIEDTKLHDKKSGVEIAANDAAPPPFKTAEKHVSFAATLPLRHNSRKDAAKRFALRRRADA